MLNPRVLCSYFLEKKIYHDGMSILSILLSLEPGCYNSPP
jgi:hypothetical protein